MTCAECKIVNAAMADDKAGPSSMPYRHGRQCHRGYATSLHSH